MILLVLTMGSASAAYQQQGFDQFKENADGTITFWCEKSCVMLLGEKGSSDVVRIEEGTHQ